MQVADLYVQADRLTGRAAVGGQERGQKGEDGVDGVFRWTGAAASPGKTGIAA